ncbi:MAG: hypothetical protein WC478_03440 [Candidatus Omnitrophota bacterium]
MPRISIMVLLLAVLLVCPVLADDEVKTINGSVTSIDWVTSRLTVRYPDPYSGNTDEVTFKITEDAELTRGSEAITLSDIEQGDPVEVVYYRDDAGGLKVKRLADMNDANR